MSTDLRQVIREKQLEDEHIRSITYQILRGLKYLHSVFILHRDLKPSSLTLNDNYDLRVCKVSNSLSFLSAMIQYKICLNKDH
jgi:serine/threonine protein kinase